MNLPESLLTEIAQDGFSVTGPSTRLVDNQTGYYWTVRGRVNAAGDVACGSLGLSSRELFVDAPFVVLNKLRQQYRNLRRALWEVESAMR